MTEPSILDFQDKIICGDCIEVMSKMPDGCIDLAITSPPYNLRNSTGGGMQEKSTSWKWKNCALQKGYKGHDDNMPHDDYVEWQRESLRQMYRLLSDEGAIFYNHKWRVQGGLLQGREDIMEGFPVRQIIIWQRSGGLNFNHGYFVPTYEVIYVIPKKGFRIKKKALGYGDVWKINQCRGNPHPAPFPIEIPDRIISSVEKCDTVLDPYVGSGTTTLAAKALGKHYVGIDVSEEYCQMAEERMKDDLPILDGLDSREDVKLQPDNLGEMVGG